ncbi:type VII secretion protein [Wenjunlia vitaminophila]|uniref:Type VII secretion protein n=2 Tax=Wenjunlia vitaminophila TaxID=76728 RepID=A0A0T6LY01_WENVI|nr:type VII secretion protein [Wenjunlia vitaminophila]
MRDAAKKLQNGQQEIEQKLADLKKLVTSLVNGGYVTDRSSKQFDQSYDEFNEGAKKTIEGLDGMGKFLESAADAFERADDELAKGLGK